MACIISPLILNAPGFTVHFVVVVVLAIIVVVSYSIDVSKEIDHINTILNRIQ